MPHDAHDQLCKQRPSAYKGGKGKDRSRQPKGTGGMLDMDGDAEYDRAADDEDERCDLAVEV